MLGELGLAGRLKKQLAERMLAAELSHHLESETAAAGDNPVITATAPARNHTSTAMDRPREKTRIDFPIGLEATSSTPARFKQIMQADIEKWAKVIKDANIKAE